MMDRYIIDYYLTKKVEDVEISNVEILKKCKTFAYVKNDNFPNKNEFYIKCDNFSNIYKPSQSDMIFLTDKRIFYEVISVKEKDNNYIIEVKKMFKN